MTTDDKLARMTAINQTLRRQLEQCRKETVEACAKFCEEHSVAHGDHGSFLIPLRRHHFADNPGDSYAKGLRGMIGE
jgi:hypothetical protein